ncbi:MAG: hypothetical protein JRI68_20240 [Deltaproteobacteria bacterium]|nr:hypothetical protein [Deltaproteobacteria bacterium]
MVQLPGDDRDFGAAESAGAGDLDGERYRLVGDDGAGHPHGDDGGVRPLGARQPDRVNGDSEVAQGVLQMCLGALFSRSVEATIADDHQRLRLLFGTRGDGLERCRQIGAALGDGREVALVPSPASRLEGHGRPGPEQQGARSHASEMLLQAGQQLGDHLPPAVTAVVAQ